MRVVPLVIALLVSVAIYVFVFQRDSVAGLTNAPGSDTVQTETAAPAADETARTSASGVATPVHVIAVHSSAREIDSAVSLRGQTAAFRQVDVRAETSGLVISTPLRKGSFVEAGQLLCRLDPANRQAVLAEAKARLSEARAAVPAAEARVTEAKARLEEAEINDNAAEKLSKGGYASDTRVASTKASVSAARAVLQTAVSGLESAEAGIQSAQASVKAAESEIGRLEITAPFGGLLESDTAELGSLMQPGALCATVIQLDPVLLVGFVPETDVTRLAVDAQAQARLITGETVSGTVTFVSRSADPNTRTFRVEIEVPNPDLRVRDGQTADIAVSADGIRAHLLPQSALTLDDTGTLGVRIVSADSQALFVPVTFLRDTEEGMWLSGLPDEADVIVVGQEYVIDGVPVVPSYEALTQ